MNNSIKLESIDSKCPNCGNSLKYSPEDVGLKCESCGTREVVEYSVQNKKQPYDNVNDDEIVAWQKSKKHIKCKSCGSTIELENNEISIDCPYCDSQNVVAQKDIKGLNPSFLIKFTFGRKTALAKFKEQVKKKFFVPRPFKKDIPENQIEGFYFPAFSFDADSVSAYSGRLYRYESRGYGDKARTVTVYFNVSGSLAFNHRDVLVESSSRLSQYQLEQMFPYNFDLKVDFKPEYLFGYVVEQYNEQFDKIVDKVEYIFKDQIKSAILRKYHYDGVERLDVNSSFSNEWFGYIMMPVYSFEYNYKKKKYLTYMNGQTGKVGGGLPISKIKVAFCSILALLIVAVPVVLAIIFGE